VQAIDHQLVNKKEYDAANASDMLRSLLKDDLNHKLEETEMSLALGCLSAAVSHLRLHSSGEKGFTLEKYTLTEYLRLDVAALAALNVFPQKNHELLSGSAGSLYGLLNQCKTSIGTRLLKQWLKQPTTRHHEIENRLSIVEYLHNNESLRSDLQSVYLKSFPDIEKLYSKFYRVHAKLRNSAQLLDCVKVYNMIGTLEGMCQYLEDNLSDDQDLHLVIPLKQTLPEFLKLKGMLEECIDLSKAKQNAYVINPNFDPALKELTTELRQIRKRMESMKQSVQDDLNTSKRVDLVESNAHGYMFEVDKKEGDAGMRQSRNEYKILSMNKNKRVMSFTCEELKELVR